MRVVQTNPWLDHQCRTYQAAPTERRVRLRADAMASMLAAHPFARTLLSSGVRAERDAAWAALRAACEAAGSPDSPDLPARDLSGPADAVPGRAGASITVLHEPMGTAD